jgi:hypothetical protein
MHSFEHGNQIANEASVARSGWFDTPKHDPHKVGGIFRAEFLHNVGTMKLYGAATDVEAAGCLLAGGAAHDLSENHSLARGQ